MPVTIEVYRDAGDWPGAEVREPLLGESLEAALERGRAELDANAHGWERVSLEADYQPDLALGALVEVDDPLQGVAWRGQVVGIMHRFTGGAVTTTLEIRRPIT